MLMRLLRRAQYWLHHRRNAADLEEEMAFHRSMTTGAGFGNATLAHEDARGVWTLAWLETHATPRDRCGGSPPSPARPSQSWRWAWARRRAWRES